MEISKEIVRGYISTYEDRKFLDVKSLLAEVAIDRDDSELMKMSIIIGLIQTELNREQDEQQDTTKSKGIKA